MNKDKQRIERIKNEHAQLVENVKECIINNNVTLNESINDVIDVLNYDESEIKKYEATIKAQELITSLTEEIVNAKTKEEIIALRRKLNYYINKIKTEIKRRNAPATILSDYQKKSNDLRKEIAKYIRFLKREDNISKIDSMYSNISSLDEIEYKEYKKLLTKEHNYNYRNLRSIKSKKQEKSNIEKKENTESEIYNTQNDIEYSCPKSTLDCSIIAKDQEVYEDSELSFFNSIMPRTLDNVEFKDVDEFLTSRVERYNHKYNIVPTYDYEKLKTPKNFANFLRNIPRNIHNKRGIKSMKKDYYTYCLGEDLNIYIAYLQERNSIKNGLKCIFQKSYLFSKENDYLYIHDKCSEWLYNFCKNNSISLPYQLGRNMNF